MENFILSLFKKKNARALAEFIPYLLSINSFERTIKDSSDQQLATRIKELKHNISTFYNDSKNLDRGVSS